MRRSNTKGGSQMNKNGEVVWELRPGGMLVQKREDGSGKPGTMIRVRVSHGTYQHEVIVPAQSTFGDLKSALVQHTGLQPSEQRLLFKGKEKDDGAYLHIMGVTDMSKVILLEDPASKERKLEEMKRNEGIAKACEAVGSVHVEVDKFAGKVSALESMVSRGISVAEKEFVVLTELLMRQLLKLDSIEAEGEAKVQRRIEVRRAQSLIEALDILKAKNSSPYSSSGNAMSVATQWKVFDSGFGSLVAPPPKPPPKVTSDWELFD